MFNYLKRKIIGSYSDKELKRYKPYLLRVNALESEYRGYSETQYKEKTEEFKKRIADGEKLDDILPEAFALVRNAAMDTLGERPYDVQILGGIALFKGRIAEMKTGEGKTLTSTLPLYLYALTGKGAHLVTVNDYLAERDANWMGKIYHRLGVTVGVIVHGKNDNQRREAYRSDITYGTNNEFGFDFLRDNMKFDLKDYVQREHHFAIVDEVDSILVDEARTPLIISGPAEDSTESYHKIDKQLFGLAREYRVVDNPDPEAVAKEQNIGRGEVSAFLKQKEDLDVVIPGDFTLEEKSRNIQLAERGVAEMEKRLTDMLKTPNLFDFENIEILHHVNQALKAHYVFKRDIDYVVQEHRVLIVDEFTGRIMEGRRFSDGLHQALEAKERVKIERENQTLASITYQNYFRKYEILAGMTGTAETEAEEFMKIYGLGVVVVPTNEEMIRKDHPDVIFKTKAAKHRAIVNQIKDLNKNRQPVLVGVASVESSEYLSGLLKKHRVSHSVLNAKYHAQEADIIAKAGQPGVVTIATNMAGRGTDIKLGSGVREEGGLFILGTERNESRRVDNQLRGRSGRQGDPGASRFFLSLEDDLLRIFGGERIANLMNRLKIDEDEAIEHVLISRAIENSQKKVEAHNFDIRKHLLEYDDVMNRQREIIYRQRRRILGEEKEDVLYDMIADVLDLLLDTYCDEKQVEQWNFEGLKGELYAVFQLRLPNEEERHSDTQDTLYKWISKEVRDLYERKKTQFGEVHEPILRQILLETTDSLWKDHLLSMDHLKEGIGMRGYAQKNPLIEYKKEGFQLFSSLMERISSESVKHYFRVSIVREPPKEIERKRQEMEMIHGELNRQQNKTAPKQAPARKRALPGRNQPCHCGSGKKYKHCHMKEDRKNQV